MSSYRSISARLLIAATVFTALFLATIAEAGESWTEPGILWPEAWEDPAWFDLDDLGQRLVTVNPNTGLDLNNRDVVVTEQVSGVWQLPIVLASNGTFSGADFQFLPTHTEPRISGDGETVIYVGWNGSSNQVYVSDRIDGSWTAPAPLPTGLDNHHYAVSISRDGDTAAFCHRPFSFTDPQEVYVIRRVEDEWGPPTKVSLDSGLRGGLFPSLDAEARGIAYAHNTQILFVEADGDQWAAAVQVTDHRTAEQQVEYPRLSADGRTITYWLVDLEAVNQTNVRVAQNLLQLQRQADQWGAPEQVNGNPITPTHTLSAMAATNATGTRVVYPREVVFNDPMFGESIVGSHLEISERTPTGWQERRLVEYDGRGGQNFNRYPWLSPDGLTLNFEAYVRNTPTPTVGALWTMSTALPPPVLPIFFSGFE